VAWYSGRIALRVLPFVALQPLEVAWKDKAVRAGFSILNALTLLQSTSTDNVHELMVDIINELKQEFFSTKEAQKVYKKISSSRAYTARGDSYEKSNDKHSYDELDIFSIAAYVASEVIYVLRASSIVSFATRTVSDISFEASEATKKAASLAGDIGFEFQKALAKECILDFNNLVAGENVLLNKPPVWANEPSSFSQFKATLLNELESIGLEFLIQDTDVFTEGGEVRRHRIDLYKEVIKHSVDVRNSSSHLRAFYSGASTTPNPAVRVMLVGAGGAGKTSLFNLLLNRQKSPSSNATIAIDIAQIDLNVHRDAGVDVDLNGDFNNLDIYQWDFGGQSVFYNLHRGFMRRENCVYVLVVDSRHEQAPDDWLAQIQHYVQSDGSGEAPTVLVVTNAYENIEREQNQTYLARQYKPLLEPVNEKFPDPFFTLNCTQADARFDYFLEALLHACKASQKRIMSTTREAIDKLQKQFEGKKAITISDFADTYFNKDSYDEAFLLEKNSLENLGYLVDLNPANSNQLGVVQQPGYHGDNLILDPKWITRVAYQAINHQTLKRCGGYISRDNFKRKVLKSLQQDELDSSDNEVVIQFLVAQGVTYPFEVTTKNNRRQSMLFFPDAAPAKEPVHIANILRQPYDWRHGKPLRNEIIVEYVLPAFPMSLNSILAISLLKLGYVELKTKPPYQSNIQSELNIWRDGLLVNFEHDVQIVVFFHQSKNRVELKCIYSPELPTSYMQKQFHSSNRLIAEHALAEPIKIMHEVINHPSLGNGKAVLPMLHGNSTNLPQREAIFHKLPGYKTTETRTNFETDIPANIYLSYAWGAENEVHQQISDAIVNAFKEDESINLRHDREAMNFGNNLESFEQDLGRAAQAIVIFSAKSLKSEHCMRELAYLQQTSLKEKRHFQQRVIPVVLDDVQIDNTLARGECVKYWTQKRDELMQLGLDIDDEGFLKDLNVYQEICKSLYSSLSWSADILLDRDWQNEQTYDLITLVKLLKRRIRENQHRMQ